MGWPLKLRKCPSVYGMTQHGMLGQQRWSVSKQFLVTHPFRHLPLLQNLWDMSFKERQLSQFSATFLLVYPQGSINLSTDGQDRNARVVMPCILPCILPCLGRVMHGPWVQKLAKAPNNRGQDPCQISSQALTFTTMCDAKH